MGTDSFIGMGYYESAKLVIDANGILWMILGDSSIFVKYLKEEEWIFHMQNLKAIGKNMFSDSFLYKQHMLVQCCINFRVK